MNKRKKIISFFLIIFYSFFVGCSVSTGNIDANTLISPSSSNTNSSTINGNNQTFNFNVWCYQFDVNKLEEEFYTLFPKAKINITPLESMDTDTIINSLAQNNEKTPDIIIYSLDYIGDFNAIDAFEDLSKEPYSAKKLKANFNESDLNSCMSMTKDKLIALPFTQASTLTYYRADILEELGLPSDPTELGDLMSTPEGWLSIAKRLKEEDKYALQWKDEFVKLALNTYGVFDENMNLNIDSDIMKDSLYLANETYNLGLIGKYDLWTDQGRAAVRDGTIAMLHMNKWGEDYLKETAPDTMGKWRVTRLPLNLYCSANTNAISIVSTSKYKTEAWSLVKKLVLSESAHYNSILNDESKFLGGQQANLLYADVAQKQPLIQKTMLDDIASSTVIQAVNNHTEKTLDIYNFITSTQLKIINSIGQEQVILSKYINSK